jgi:hypothetical protein
MAFQENSADKTPAITGENTFVQTGGGLHRVELRDGAGVVGHSTRRHGVIGIADSAGFSGVYGKGESEGVTGTTTNGTGVFGYSTGPNGIGVKGQGGDNNAGIYGSTLSASRPGVWGQNNGTGPGVEGHSNNEAGVRGVSTHGTGVVGIGGSFAGEFVGKVRVQGDIEVSGDIRLMNADCAEDFDIAGVETPEPGTVMVLSDDGALKPSDRAYDKRVAGVVSGAGSYKPGIVLDTQPAPGNRSPIALLGKVYCKVDASTTPVEVGDLLTTSDTPGHAMKASDSTKAFGSVIGKALCPLREGQGLIPVLIALQ